jgi:competence protein ComEA
MFSKLSKKIGFTETEITVILFLAGVFILGFIYKEFFKDKNTPEYKNFDYLKEDSLFNYYSNNSSDDSLLNSNLETKRKVLELSDSITYKKKDTSELPEKGININTAEISELVKLPGIGEKTAEKIILLRTQRGKFRNINEIMDVKGIGEAKFNKIKKFLYIE